MMNNKLFLGAYPNSEDERQTFLTKDFKIDHPIYKEDLDSID